MEFVHVVAVAAAVLTIAFAWPQALEVLRAAPDVDGVSVPTAVLVLFSGASWWLYGLLTLDATIIVADGGTLAASIFTLVVLGRRGRRIAATLGAMTAGWIFLLAGALVVAGEAAAGVVGAVLGIAMTLPQAWRSVRGHGTEGVSLATYALLLVMTSVWLLYGFLTDNAVIIVPNLIAVTVDAAVLSLLVSQRRREAMSGLTPSVVP